MAKNKASGRITDPTPDEAAAAAASMHTNLPIPSARKARLLAYQPRTITLPAEVKTLIADLICATPAATMARDMDLMAAAIKNADHDISVYGDYQARRAMSEQSMRRWWLQEQRHRVKESSAATYRSMIRVISRANNMDPSAHDRLAAKRKPVSPPLGQKEWRRLSDFATTRLGRGTPAHVDYQMLLDLVFGAGLRATEISAALRCDLEIGRGGDGLLNVANTVGKMREVPLGPVVVGRILSAQRQDPMEHLFRPHHSRKKNPVGVFQDWVAEKHPELKFDIAAARSRFIVDCMTQRLPFAVVCHIADLGPGGHTAQDLARHCPTPSPADIRAAVKETWT